MIYINGESVAPVGNININTEHNYSTDEQVIGTWIDGRPVYEKTITAQLTTATETNITVSTENIEIVNFNGFFALSSNTYERLPLVYQDITRLYQVNATTIRAYGRANYTSLTLTIQYTKSADTGVNS